MVLITYCERDQLNDAAGISLVLPNSAIDLLEALQLALQALFCTVLEILIIDESSELLPG